MKHQTPSMPPLHIVRRNRSPATIIAVFLLVVAASATPGDVPWRTDVTSPRITTLKSQVDSGNVAAIDEFWREVKSRHAPLVEPLSDDSHHVLVTFVYRGDGTINSLVLYCQMIPGRDPAVNVLTHLGKTDLWYKTYWVRSDMRLTYSFVPNPTESSLNSSDLQVADPLNPKAGPNAPYMGHSVLELPEAAPDVWSSPRPQIPAGKLEPLEVSSKVLKSSREAWVYTPAGYDPKRAAPYPLLVCFDGLGYASLDYVPLPTILDNLIGARKLAPLVLLLVGQSPQPQRNIELGNNQPFLDFVANELLVKVRAQWHVTSNPAQTTVCGSSSGGLAAAFFAFKRPDVFGNVLSQSGAFWPGQVRSDPRKEWLTQQYEVAPKLPIRFVLQVGTLERGPTPMNGPSILETNRHLRDVLTRKGYELHYNEVAGGHEPINWRAQIADGLLLLMNPK